MPKSDLLVYALAILLGISAGILNVTVGDVLVTTLFVLIATLALGFMRPRRAWRWILIVGTFVPLLQLVTYFFLGWKPYRAQIWESGLGFLTGTAGCYCGALGRLGVDELVHK
jgi:hypothetical protein